MGLFSRKKKVDVPLPPSEEILRFPRRLPMEREILPAPKRMPETERLPKEPEPVQSSFPSQTQVNPNTQLVNQFFFLRMVDYQNLIGNLDNTNLQVQELEHTMNKLEASEFNENRDYEALKSNLKKVHERLLYVDKLIFK